jgi:hypothetical protein
MEMTTWKGQAFEREWHRAMLEWIDGGQVGSAPFWEFIDDAECSDWYIGIGKPAFKSATYRWAPKPKRTVTINGKVLVAPQLDAPAEKTCYWSITSYNELVDMHWTNHGIDHQHLSSGNVFLTREDAQAMADWLVKCRRGET